MKRWAHGIAGGYLDVVITGQCDFELIATVEVGADILPLYTRLGYLAPFLNLISS